MAGAFEPIRVAVLTVSDGCSRGVREDRSGTRIVEWCDAQGHILAERDVVPDDVGPIASRLAEWSDGGHVDVIVTTGGTGFGPRDVTPEATRSILEREAPGLAEELRRQGRASTPYAMLSRGLCGTRSSTLVVNLPGSTGGVENGLTVLHPILVHTVRLLRGDQVSHGGASAARKVEPR